MTMGFSIAPRDLRRAAGLVRLVTRRRVTIPVLAMVRAEWTGETVTFSGTDLDSEVAVTVPCRGQGRGSVLVPLHKLNWAAGAAGEVSFGIEGRPVRSTNKTEKFLVIAADDITSLSRVLIDAGDWPDMLFGLKEPVADLTASQAELHRLLARSRWSISTEETRYYLNGVFLTRRPEGTTLRAVTTDGHRMAVIDSDLAWPEAVSGIVPRHCTWLLLRALDPRANEPVALRMDRLRAEFTGPGWCIRAKLIDGTYPNYQRVIPPLVEKASFVLNTHGFRRVFAATESGDKSPCFAFDPVAGRMRIRRADEDLSGPLEGCVAEGEAGFTVGFNGHHISDLLAFAGTARFSCATSADPARITTEEPNEFFIMMPMRV